MKPTKTLRPLIFISLLALAIGRLSAQTPMDYFKAGQFEAFSTYFQYQKDQAAQLSQKYKDGRELFVKAGASKAVLDAYDTMSTQLLTLPFDKDYSTWPQDKKDLWNKLVLDTKARNEWLGADNTPPKFYYWLGYDTLRLGKAIPMQIKDLSNTLDSQMSAIKTAVSDFVWFAGSHPDVFKTLKPEFQDDIKAVAAYQAKVTDPLGDGISLDDLTAMQAKIDPLLKAGRTGTLNQ